jgi:hypothetical protein
MECQWIIIRGREAERNVWKGQHDIVSCCLSVAYEKSWDGISYGRSVAGARCPGLFTD